MIKNIPVKINTEYIKLDQLLKFAGVVETGGIAKEVIQAGYVKVNDGICSMRGKKIRSGDKISFENIEITVS